MDRKIFYIFIFTIFILHPSATKERERERERERTHLTAGKVSSSLFLPIPPSFFLFPLDRYVLSLDRPKMYWPIVIN